MQIHSTENRPQKAAAWFRRSILALAVIALAGYIVAAVQATRGAEYYQEYVAAFNVCYQHVMSLGGPVVNCNKVENVAAPLALHRNAYAFGEPFLNLALSLTFAILCLPLLRKLAGIITRRLLLPATDASEDAGQRVVVPAIDTAEDVPQRLVVPAIGAAKHAA